MPGKNLFPENALPVASEQKGGRNLFPQRTDEKQEVDDFAKEYSSLDAVIIGMGRTGDKLYQGVKNLYFKATGDEQAAAALAEQELNKDKSYRSIAEEHPIASTVGEILPYFAVPGGVAGGAASKALSVIPKAGKAAGAVGKSVVADAALTGAAIGGLTYSPDQLESAAMGAAGGAVGAGLTKVAGGIIAPVKKRLTGVQKELAETGEQLGLKLTPGQRTGSNALQKLEAGIESFPPTAGISQEIRDANQRVINKLSAESIGESADEVGFDVLGRAAKQIGRGFDEATANKQIALDDTFVDVLGALDDKNVTTWVKDTNIKNVIDAALDEAEKGFITGERYQQLASQLTKKARSALRGQNSNPEYAFTLFKLKNALDDAVESSLGKVERKQFNKLRSQYKMLMAIESPGVLNETTGNISMAKLANVLRRIDKKGFKRGQNRSSLYDVARFGQAFKSAVGDSGTATRAALPYMLYGGLGAGSSVVSGGDPLQGLAAGVALPVAANQLAKMYMRGYPSTAGIFPPLTRNITETGLNRLSSIAGRTGTGLAISQQR